MPIILAQAEPPPAAASASKETNAAPMDVSTKPAPAAVRPKGYPERAWREHIEGSAVIHCKVTASGLLTGCAAVKEQPDGEGFGQAAIELSALFKMKWRGGGSGPVEGEVNIPIRFQIPKR